MGLISESYETVRGNVARACESAGRDPGSVELVAVGKTWPAEVLMELVQCGHRVFGENRVQELEVKAPALPAHLDWHFIGRLQKNKVRKVLIHCSTVHSIDSAALAQRVDGIAADLGAFPKVYLQVNAAEEASKSGFTPDSLIAELPAILELERLEVLGLMAIPPVAEEPEDTRPDFRALRELRDRLEDLCGVGLPGLSMGMSHDYEVAIAEGATAIRVGSSIFGPRRAWKQAGGGA